MYQVSQEYKESMKRPIRNRSYMVITIGMINQEAQRSSIIDNQNEYVDYSNFSGIFDNNWNGKQYATYEQDFFKADGNMLFLPSNNSNRIKNGLISKQLFPECSVIRFKLQCGKTDIKGLTIQFGENYPTEFTVTTCSGEEITFLNDSSFFETDEVFTETDSIAITVKAMSVPNNRLRICYVKFGLGLEYNNDWIKSAESKSTQSMIDDDLPQVDFGFTLKNEEQILDIDNPDSAINFFESGQRVDVEMGYEMDNGRIEWLHMHTLYLSEWSSDDTKTSIKAVDKLQMMNDTYYKGRYYKDGISLYDLSILVFEDAGIVADEYYVDPYLRKVIVKNPLPNVCHKEALQIIANAGRCSLGYDRFGRINIHSAFTPSFMTYSNGTFYASEVDSIENSQLKNSYATFERDYWKADGSMLFFPKSGLSNCGYISSQISGDDGTFSENPVITRIFETTTTIYELPIKFQNNVVSDFVIKTYAGNVLVDTMNVEGNELLDLSVKCEFLDFDKMEIEFIKTKVPNSRVKIDEIAPGSETNYRIEYDDLYSMPIGTQSEKIKNLNVARTMLTESASMEELVADNVTFSGESLIYYFSYPCYGYTVSIAPSGNVSIVDSGSYYIKISLSGIEIGTDVTVSIQGYKYNESTAYLTKEINDKGNDKEWNNPIISDINHAKQITEWLVSYFKSSIEYVLDYRGEPALDVGDTVFQDNKYEDKLKTIIEECQLKFEQSISGAIKTRRKGNVDRTKNQLVRNRLF